MFLIPSTVFSQAFEEDITVRIVNIDLHVLDKKGNPILNLNRDAVKIFEDGVEQTITHFSEISLKEQMNIPHAGEHPEEIVFPETVTPSRKPTCFLVFVDLARMNIGDWPRARKILNTFLGDYFMEGDRISIVTSSPSLETFGPYSDLDEAITVFKKAKSNGV